MYKREHDSPRGDRGSPYYIGKGKGKRAYSNNHSIGIPSNMDQIVFIETNIPEETAFMLEEYWISYFGRIDLGTGCLHNKTNGGDGVSGIVGRTPWNKGKPGYTMHTDEYKNQVRTAMSKTLVEKYGEERAKIIKDNASARLKDKTHQEIYGEKSENIKAKIGTTLQKPLIEIVGKDRFDEAIAHRQKNYKLHGFQFKKGMEPSNKLTIPKVELENMNEMRLSGVIWTEIATQYGYCLQAIVRNFKQENLVRITERTNPELKMLKKRQ
jgi:hypothetical protein